MRFSSTCNERDKTCLESLPIREVLTTGHKAKCNLKVNLVRPFHSEGWICRLTGVRLITTFFYLLILSFLIAIFLRKNRYNHYRTVHLLNCEFHYFLGSSRTFFSRCLLQVWVFWGNEATYTPVISSIETLFESVTKGKWLWLGKNIFLSYRNTRH